MKNQMICSPGVNGYFEGLALLRHPPFANEQRSVDAV